MKVYLCAIGKNENRYIKEWVDYHLSIGFDKIILFDNNDVDGERFETVLQSYVYDDKVELVYVRGKEKQQLPSYEYAYKRYESVCDWMAFFDCDEFLTFADGVDLKHWIFYLDKINLGVDCIYVNWMCYGDCENLFYDNKPVLERFPDPLPFHKCTIYEFPQNCHVKSIVKTGSKTISFSNPHTPDNNNFIYCSPSGCVLSHYTPFLSYDYSFAWLRHYTTKTISEWKDKMNKGYPDQSKEESKKNLTFDMFFKWNEKTEEKLKIANE